MKHGCKSNHMRKQIHICSSAKLLDITNLEIMIKCQVCCHYLPKALGENISAFLFLELVNAVLCRGLGGSDRKESACDTGDMGSIPRSGRSPGEGNGYPLQYSCLVNSMDRGAWRAMVHGVANSQTQLSNYVE